MDALDLYAKVESLIGFYDEYENLYEKYKNILLGVKVDSLLDVGCGNGRFLESLKEIGIHTLGVDKSKAMVTRAKMRGVEAVCGEFAGIQGEFDCITAVADVCNYFDKEYLALFLEDVQAKLKKGGVFVFDLNTLHGFSDVTAGSLIKSDADSLLAIDAEFDGKRLHTIIELFTKAGNHYIRESGEITQYFHTKKEIERLLGKKCERCIPVKLFSDRADKEILLFRF